MYALYVKISFISLKLKFAKIPSGLKEPNACIPANSGGMQEGQPWPNDFRGLSQNIYRACTRPFF